MSLKDELNARWNCDGRTISPAGSLEAPKLAAWIWHSCEGDADEDDDEPAVGGQEWEMTGTNSVGYGFVMDGFIRERTYF